MLMLPGETKVVTDDFAITSIPDQTKLIEFKKRDLKSRFENYLRTPSKLNRNDFKRCFDKLHGTSHIDQIEEKDVLPFNDVGIHKRKMILEVAKADKDPRMMEWLLKKTCYINKNIDELCDEYGHTPLHEAAAADNEKVVEFLLEDISLFHPSAKNKKGQTPLHLAARYNSLRAMKVLLQHAEKDERLEDRLEAKDKYHQTPLFCAAMYGRREAASLLIKFGANASGKSRFNLEGKEDKAISEMCLTYMVENMETVAIEALDTPFYYENKLREREECFHLDKLETFRIDHSHEKKLLTPLTAIVRSNRLQLVTHPVIHEFITVKWTSFTRFWTIVLFVVDFLYCLLWTILGSAVRWYTRPFYTFPQDGWRLFMYILLSLWTIYLILEEIYHIYKSKQLNMTWSQERGDVLKNQEEELHPSWTALDKKFLIKQREVQKKSYFRQYINDFWNIIDWISYILVITNVVTHIADTFLPFRQPSCCPVATNETCDVFSPDVCIDGFVNNSNMSVWNNRIFVLTLIVLWFRLLKYIRAIAFFGTFIAMLGYIVSDVFRFFSLYLVFFIPFACGFWMIFGEISTISDFFSFDALFFTLYRLTFVDEYPLNEMIRFDIVMAYILVGTFLALSALLLINLLIALLSDTFKRIYDNAKANAAMERAKLIIQIEEEVQPRFSRKIYETKFHKDYSPYKKTFSYAKSNVLTGRESVTASEVCGIVDDRLKKVDNLIRTSVVAPDSVPDDATVNFEQDMKSQLLDMASAQSSMNRMMKRLKKLEKKLANIIENTAFVEYQD